MAQTPPSGTLRQTQPEIDRLFTGEGLTDILKDLQNDGSEFATSCLKLMGRNSPLSMACAIETTHRLRNSQLSIEKALDMEYRFTFRAMEHGDFLEGIRAQIIDKDRKPKWQFADMNVPDIAVTNMLLPLGYNALNLTGDAS
jgi:3-hydroxyisobutyrate dehydrogenase